MNNTLVYIAGTSRSGTTLIGEHLGSLNGACHMGELMYWSVIQDIHGHICSCGLQDCKILTLLSDKVSRKYTDILLGYWQRYESHFFSDIANPELFVSGEKEIDINALGKVYDHIIRSYGEIYPECSTFIDNTKCIDIANDICSLMNGSNFKIKIIIALRNPCNVLSSYIKSGVRKNVPRDISRKIFEIQEFYGMVIRLIESHPEDVRLINYEDYCISPKDSLFALLDFIGDTNISRESISSQFVSSSHLIKGNHGFIGNTRHKILNSDSSCQDFPVPPELLDTYSNLKGNILGKL